MSEERVGYIVGAKEDLVEGNWLKAIHLVQANTGFVVATDGKVTLIFPPHSTLDQLFRGFQREAIKRSEAAKRGWAKRKEQEWTS